jgi:hypothetical protein
MTETQYLIWFVAQAVVTIAILVVGTLGAADLLPRRRPRRGTPDERAAVVNTLAPLGSSLLVGARLQGRAMKTHTARAQDRLP